MLNDHSPPPHRLQTSSLASCTAAKPEQHQRPQISFVAFPIHDTFTIMKTARSRRLRHILAHAHPHAAQSRRPFGKPVMVACQRRLRSKRADGPVCRSTSEWNTHTNKAGQFRLRLSVVCHGNCCSVSPVQVHLVPMHTYRYTSTSPSPTRTVVWVTIPYLPMILPVPSRLRHGYPP